MCGICGFAGKCKSPPSEFSAILQSMTDQLQHRGPDSAGFFSQPEINLGIRRLRVIDLQTGEQPISTEDGTLQIILNGEIYNFQSLRADLEKKGHRFHTQSDTEVVLYAYQEFGVECVTHLRGMFAFAIWDSKRQRLFLARDRVGKKPLYYTHIAGQLIFASELKSLLQHPATPRAINPTAVDMYLTSGYIPAPYTILKNVYKLSPAHWLTYEIETDHLALQPYWQLDYTPKTSLSIQDTALELRHLLTEAVRLREISDVPLGAMLSGGIDSTIIVGLMSENARVKTFSIGFAEAAYNELPYARQVATQFQTDHHELIVTPPSADDLSDIAWYLDEPMADVSAIPTYYLARLARQNVTVALNGDGGDESFAGYKRYQAVMAYQRIPTWTRQLIEPALAKIPPRQNFRHPIERARRAIQLSQQPLVQQFAYWLTLFDENSRQRLYTPAFAEQIDIHDASEANLPSGKLDWMMAHDIQHYLPGDLLVKMDRMTMAYSLEARSPFLDHKVMEFAARLPENFKMRHLTGKHILKLAYQDLLPPTIQKRPKQGFAVPIEAWLNGELKSTAQAVIEMTKQRGWFQPHEIEQLSGKRLYALIVLELWLQRFSSILDL
jgi:asparagine synthase (glutamine-hydrolysing)